MRERGTAGFSRSWRRSPCAGRSPPPGWAADGTPGPYAFAEDATAVRGAEGTTDSARLEAGHTYRSSIGPSGRGGRLYYRLELDAASTAYVSATAVPRTGASVSYSDGLKVSLQDGNGRNCSSSGSAHFGATQSPHPIAAWAARETGGKQYACQTAGTYYVVVERSGAGPSKASRGATPGGTADPKSSASRVWDLEIGYVSEPGLKEARSTTAPETWDSATPEALAGTPRHRDGGAASAPRPPSDRASGGTASTPDRPASTRFRSAGGSSSPPPPTWAVRAVATVTSAPPSPCPSTTRSAASSTTSAPDTMAGSGPPRSPPFLRSPTRTATRSATA